MERPPEVNIMQGPQNVPSYVGTKLFVYGSVSAEHNSLPPWIQEMTPLSSDWNRLQMQENWTKKKSPSDSKGHEAFQQVPHPKNDS